MNSILPNITKSDFYLRVSVILFALLTPLVFFLTQGYLPSLSSYWKTPMQPLFIIANASTSYFLFASHSYWKVPAVFLLLLTAFSVQDFLVVHNVMAILFFISALIPLYLSNHFKKIFWVYLLSVFLMPISLTIGESMLIITLCTYHLLMLNKIYKLQSKK